MTAALAAHPGHLDKILFFIPFSLVAMFYREKPLYSGNFERGACVCPSTGCIRQIAEGLMDFTVILLIVLLAALADRSRDCHCGGQTQGSQKYSKPEYRESDLHF